MNNLVKLALVILLTTSNIFAQDVLSALNSLPDVKATEATKPEDIEKGLQRFSILIKQPIDHFDPSLGSFSQRIILFHRGFQAPMLLQTSGYNIKSGKMSFIATMFETNQIQVEYRFYGESRPETRDWRLLTIRQSAEDFHHIVEVFKKIYAARWVNYGASKGGQTSIDNRRYYPNDYDGTIANVAPFSLSTEDERYSDEMKNIGGDEYIDCRNNLKKFQVTLLERKEQFLSYIDGDYKLLGSKENAYNFSVNELYSVFWQYIDPEDKEFGCIAVAEAIDDPGTKAFSLFDYINSVNNYDDAAHSIMLPFYIQASYELGYSKEGSAHIQKYFTKEYNLFSLIPNNLNLTYSNSSALDTISWMATKAQNMLLIYGEFDSLTPGALTQINQNADNHRYVVAKGNHKSTFLDLPENDYSEYVNTLSGWFNKKPAGIKNKSKSNTIYLEDLEDKRVP
jgi:hypothetical protein